MVLCEHLSTSMALVLLALVHAAPSPVARVVSSESGLRLSSQPSVYWRAAAKCPAGGVEVVHGEPLQEIGGFGASITESSAIVLNALPQVQQVALLELLYGRSGARLSAMKATMLANDEAAQAPWSTYDDTVGDVRLANFSIARDLRPNGSLTMIKRAQAAGFDGTIQAYMDFPPDWMLVPTRPGLGLPNATVAPKYYGVLAAYYAKFVEAYAAHGVHIDFLEAFNEPTDSYTQMGPEELATFLGRHLGPLFEARGLWPSTRLTYGGQCSRTAAAQFIPKIMADARAARYMDVLAYHGYDCQFEDDGSCDDGRQNYSAIARLAAAFPSRPLWMTEVCYAYNGDDPNCTSAATMRSCTDYPRSPALAPPLPRTDFADGATWGHRLVAEVASGASGWIYWNLLLNTRGGPFLYSPEHADADANLQHPVIIVDTERGTYQPTGLFYYLAHFSRYVRPKARRLTTHMRAPLAGGVSAVAFRGPNSTQPPRTLVQLVNRAAAERTVPLCSGGHVADVSLPPSSITTASFVA